MNHTVNCWIYPVVCNLCGGDYTTNAVFEHWSISSSMSTTSKRMVETATLYIEARNRAYHRVKSPKAASHSQPFPYPGGHGSLMLHFFAWEVTAILTWISSPKWPLVSLAWVASHHTHLCLHKWSSQFSVLVSMNGHVALWKCRRLTFPECLLSDAAADAAHFYHPLSVLGRFVRIH